MEEDGFGSSLTKSQLLSRGRIENASSDSLEKYTFQGNRRVGKENIHMYMLYALFEYSYLYNHPYIDSLLGILVAKGIPAEFSRVFEFFTGYKQRIQEKNFDMMLEGNESLEEVAMFLQIACEKITKSYEDPVFSCLHSLSMLLSMNFNIKMPDCRLRIGGFKSITIYLKYNHHGELYILYPSHYKDDLLENFFNDKTIATLCHCGHEIESTIFSGQLVEQIGKIDNYTCKCSEKLYELEKKNIKKLGCRVIDTRNCCLCFRPEGEKSQRCPDCNILFCIYCLEENINYLCVVCQKDLKPVKAIEVIPENPTCNCLLENELVYLCPCGELKYNVQMAEFSVCTHCKILPISENSYCFSCANFKKAQTKVVFL